MKVKVKMSESLMYRRDDKRTEEDNVLCNKTYDVSSYYALMHKVLDDMEQKGFELNTCNMFFSKDSSEDEKGNQDSHLIHMFTKHDYWQENNW